MSFLEMLDVVNEDLIRKDEDAIAFDSDCREGICGACGLMINGVAHGPDAGATSCQLHMRRLKDGDTITEEPSRANASPAARIRSNARRSTVKSYRTRIAFARDGSTVMGSRAVKRLIRDRQV